MTCQSKQFPVIRADAIPCFGYSIEICEHNNLNLTAAFNLVFFNTLENMMALLNTKFAFRK